MPVSSRQARTGTAEPFTVVQNNGFAKLIVPLQLRTRESNETVKHAVVADEDETVLTSWKVQAINPGGERLISLDMTFEFGMLPGLTSLIVTVTTSADSIYSIRLIFDVIGLAIFDSKSSKKTGSNNAFAARQLAQESAPLTMYTGPKAQAMKIGLSEVSEFQSVFYGGNSGTPKEQAIFDAPQNTFPWSPKSCSTDKDLETLPTESCALGFRNSHFNTFQLRPRKITPSNGEVVTITWNGVLNSTVSEELLRDGKSGNVENPSVTVTVQVIDLKESGFASKFAIVAGVCAAIILFSLLLCCAYVLYKSCFRGDDDTNIGSHSFHANGDDDDFGLRASSETEKKGDRIRERLSMDTRSTSERADSLSNSASSKNSFRVDGIVFKSKAVAMEHSNSHLVRDLSTTIKEDDERSPSRSVNPSSAHARGGGRGIFHSLSSTSECKSDPYTTESATTIESESVAADQTDFDTGSQAYQDERLAAFSPTAAPFYHAPVGATSADTTGSFDFSSSRRVLANSKPQFQTGSAVAREALIQSPPTAVFDVNTTRLLDEKMLPFKSSEFSSKFGLGKQQSATRTASDFSLAPVELYDEPLGLNRKTESADSLGSIGVASMQHGAKKMVGTETGRYGIPVRSPETGASTEDHAHNIVAGSEPSERDFVSDVFTQTPQSFTPASESFKPAPESNTFVPFCDSFTPASETFTQDAELSCKSGFRRAPGSMQEQPELQRQPELQGQPELSGSRWTAEPNSLSLQFDPEEEQPSSRWGTGETPQTIEYPPQHADDPEPNSRWPTVPPTVEQSSSDLSDPQRFLAAFDDGTSLSRPGVGNPAQSKYPGFQHASSIESNLIGSLPDKKPAPRDGKFPTRRENSTEDGPESGPLSALTNRFRGTRNDRPRPLVPSAVNDTVLTPPSSAFKRHTATKTAKEKHSTATATKLPKGPRPEPPRPPVSTIASISTSRDGSFSSTDDSGSDDDDTLDLAFGLKPSDTSLRNNNRRKQ